MTGRQRNPFDMREFQAAEIMRFNPNHDDPRDQHRTRRTDSIAATQVPATPIQTLEYEKPPRYSLRESMLYFNNQFADTTNLTNGEFSFDISRLNNQSTLGGVIEIKLAPSFLFPLIAVPTYAPDFHQFNRIFIVFTTVQQCVGAYAARRFHFECAVSFPLNVVDVPDINYRKYMILTPISPIFYLDTPITIDTLNVQFLFPVMRGPGTQPAFVAGGTETPVGLVGGVIYTPVQIPQSITGIGFAPVPLPPVVVSITVTTIVVGVTTSITCTLNGGATTASVFNLAAGGGYLIPCSFTYISGAQFIDTSGNDALESINSFYGITGRIITTLGASTCIVTVPNNGLPVGTPTNLYNMYIYQNRIAFSAGFVSQSVPGDSILGGCHS